MNWPQQHPAPYSQERELVARHEGQLTCSSAKSARFARRLSGAQRRRPVGVGPPALEVVVWGQTGRLCQEVWSSRGFRRSRFWAAKARCLENP